MPIRTPAVAGMFYEEELDALRAQVERCFLRPPGPGRMPAVNAGGPRAIAGLVVPHAGLIYSGYVAAHAYAALADDGPVAVAVILSPNHRGPGAADMAIWPEGAWDTPFGSVPVAADVASAIRAGCPRVQADLSAHLAEHSIEVQLPFLQVLYGAGFSIVPISLRRYSLPDSEALGEAIAGALAGRNAVVIASSDMSHYEPAERAREQDQYALEAVTAMDPAELFARVAERDISACGYGPIAAMLVAAKRLGARKAEVLAYTNSGDITGDHRQVVGYAAAVVKRDS